MSRPVSEATGPPNPGTEQGPPPVAPCNAPALHSVLLCHESHSDRV
jgi:hypothetical protein